jgi:hypothetical protein
MASKTFSRQDGVTLKEHFYSLLQGLEKQIEQARLGMEKRLDGMNEFRDTLKDQASKFITRDAVASEIANLKDDFASQIANLAKDIRILNTFKDAMEGKASQRDVVVAQLMGLAGVILALVNFLFGK